MKRLNNLLLVLLLAPVTLLAQDANELMYNAYLHRSADTWKKALELRKASADKFDLAFTYFSLLNNTLAIPDKDLFDEHVDDAKELLNTLIDANPKSGNYPAMLGNIYGNEIGHSPMKGMLIGNKAGSLVGKGKSLEPTSPLTWYVLAVNKYYTPSAFGGSYQESADAATKSVELMEAKPLSLKNNWMYLDALVLLGNAQLKLNNKTAAIAAYQKALVREPSFEYAHILLEKAK
jgi:tetratricopeptide (TPR) repeat protein